MTIRDYLTTHLRRATFFCWAGSLVAIVLAFAWRHQPISIRIILLVIWGILYGIAYYYHFGARCPHCHTRLLFALMSFGVRLRIPSWYTSCPSCGLSFDVQRDGDPGPNQAMERTADRSASTF